MKLLRKIIRKLILEGVVKDAFEEKWYNTEIERSRFGGDSDLAGTMHRDQLEGVYTDADFVTNDEIEELFKSKRDLKRLWNETIDANGLRSFWEGPKMKYYHSLSYYGSPASAVDTLQTDIVQDTHLQDLSAKAFYETYKKSGNKDEMSTYGIYNGSHNIPRQQLKFGVILSGRVTLATSDDAFTESRSKATPKDIARHASSGMPKRIMPSDEMVATLLFEEQEIIDYPGDLGECILDNWSVEAVVVNKNSKWAPAAQELADKYGVPVTNLKGRWK